MNWVEIIAVRSPLNISKELVNDFLNVPDEPDRATETPKHLVSIKIYSHSVVETDLSIHIHWESEKESENKSPLGLRLASALKPLGLLNHSVWIETAALEFPRSDLDSKSRAIVALHKEEAS
jgi:hypothetical protein